MRQCGEGHKQDARTCRNVWGVCRAWLQEQERAARGAMAIDDDDDDDESIIVIGSDTTGSSDGEAAAPPRSTARARAAAAPPEPSGRQPRRRSLPVVPPARQGPAAAAAGELSRAAQAAGQGDARGSVLRRVGQRTGSASKAVRLYACCRLGHGRQHV